MKIKTSELTGAALDWAVALCVGLVEPFSKTIEADRWTPSTDWAQGGPIIERECIMFHSGEDPDLIRAYLRRTGYALPGCSWPGQTHLVAAMRCFVASKLGDEVEVPEELLS